MRKDKIYLRSVDLKGVVSFFYLAHSRRTWFPRNSFLLGCCASSEKIQT